MITLHIPIPAYITQFNEKAEDLSKTKLEDAPPVEVRNKQVDEMIEEYYMFVGKMPKSEALRHLADYILISDLKNKDVDKVSNEEYPILSNIQLKRRGRKQMLMKDDALDFLNNKYNKNLDSLSKTSIKKPEY
ncbi:hypothetical protein V7128_07480 [Neobacillus vireti]|uniref:hypothetical protein n=1 Tax=Neobacillus vireti TaxID=220686 RepID=UPI002FFDD7CB